MKLNRNWTLILGGGTAVAALLGYLVHSQYGKIEETRVLVTSLHADIAGARKKIEGTPALEREVIVLRELRETMGRILPDNEDVNNLVRTFQKFSEESGVRISGLKKRQNDGQNKGEFDRVAYTISLEADAFQFLDFLDLIEGHARFMRVPSFHIAAPQRAQRADNDLPPAHKIQVDVETFVYEPGNEAKPVKVDAYERKRDLLMAEITRRRAGLAVSTYEYHGGRGRRDPWIDPRVPILGDGESALSVQEQMDLVEGLVVRAREVDALWLAYQKVDGVVAELTARAELESSLARLEEDLRRVTEERAVRYVPSERRLRIEVGDVVARLRQEVSRAEAGEGPSATQLRELEGQMVRHEERGEYKLMLDAYTAIEPHLPLAERDALRGPIVERLRLLARLASTVLDFERIEVDVGGVAVGRDGIPSAIINGRSQGVGDLVQKDLVIRAIRSEEIEFIYRGVIFARTLEGGR